MSADKFSRGDQIVYIPNHADGNIKHSDVEFGFVTSVKNGTVFCRFWRDQTAMSLRTMANSEGCKPDNLRKFHVTQQGHVDMWLVAFSSESDPHNV